MLDLKYLMSYGQPDREQTIRLIQIWNHEHPDKTPMEINEAEIEAMSCAAEYDAGWRALIKKYEGAEL